VTEINRVLDLRKVRRDRLRVKLPMQAVQYPAGGYWDDEAISEMPASRYNHASIVHNNYAYIIGGSFVGGGITASIIRLDLSNPTGAWDDAGVTNLPVATMYPGAFEYAGYLYVFGGYASPGGWVTKTRRLDLSNPTGAWDDAGVGAALLKGF
jgi:hypothetical protein